MVALVALLAGCTGEDDDRRGSPTLPEPSVVESTTAASSHLPMPSVAPAMKVQTPKGAEAAFRYYLEAYTYAFATGDPTPLNGRSLPSCVFCESVRADLRSMAADQQLIRGGGLKINALMVTPGNIPTEALVGANVTQSSAVTVDVAGKPVATDPAEVGIHIDALMVWVDDVWKVQNLRYEAAQ